MKEQAALNEKFEQTLIKLDNEIGNKDSIVTKGCINADYVIEAIHYRINSITEMYKNKYFKFGTTDQPNTYWNDELHKKYSKMYILGVSKDDKSIDNLITSCLEWYSQKEPLKKYFDNKKRELYTKLQ